MVWEDGFCNFAASTGEVSSGECSGSGSTAYGHSDYQQYQGLQPELFFKMSHEIYNYGEGYVRIIYIYIYIIFFSQQKLIIRFVTKIDPFPQFSFSYSTFSFWFNVFGKQFFWTRVHTFSYLFFYSVYIPQILETTKKLSLNPYVCICN